MSCHIASIKFMAEHKVPQDVEAEDKLLGPFSFRQFIYLMIALMAIALAYFMSRMIIFLAIIPAPIAIVFLILALPLRKDQPMETYVSALIHFYLTPNRRLWEPDGQESLVEITNPPIDSEPQIKAIGGAEAAQRLSFLAEIEDTQGWSTRGITGMPINTTNLNDDFAIAASDVPDILAMDDSVSKDFNERLEVSERQRREQTIARLNTITEQASSTIPSNPDPYVYVPKTQTTPTAQTIDEDAISAALKQSSQQTMPVFQQTVIQPLSLAPAAPRTRPAEPSIPTLPPIQTQPASIPPTPSPVRVQNPVAEAPKNTIFEKPVEHTINNSQSVKIESASDNIQKPITDVFTPPPSRKIDGQFEGVISHDNNPSGNEEIEVKLH